MLNFHWIVLKLNCQHALVTNGGKEMQILVIGVVIGAIAWALIGYFLTSAIGGISPITGVILSAFFGALFGAFATTAIGMRSG